MLNHAYGVYILAGGDSRRWGGKPKALAPVWGMPMASIMIQRLTAEDQVAKLVVRSVQQAWACTLPASLIIESEALPAGPMRGILAALQDARDSGLGMALIVPCDMPWIPLDIAKRLFDCMRSQRADGAVLVDAHGQHSLCILLSTATIPVIEALLSSGEQRVKMYLTKLNIAKRYWYGVPQALLNGNQPDDVSAGAIFEMK